MYGGYASSILSKKDNLSTVMMSVYNLDFNSIWKSQASEKLLTSLDDLMNKMETERSNLTTFANAIKRIDECIEIDEKIAELNVALSAIDTSTDEGAAAAAAIQNQINELKQKKEQIKNEVKSAISGFGSASVSNSASVNNVPANELSYDDAVVLAEKLQVPVDYILGLHLHEGYEIGDRLIPEGITPDVIHYAGPNGYPILIEGIKDLGDKYKADAPERNTYFIKTDEKFSVVNGGSEYNIQGWPITFGETEGRDIYWTYYGPISQGNVLNRDAAPIRCTDTLLYPCDDGHYRDKDGYIVIAGSPYKNQFTNSGEIDYEANGGLDYEDTFVVTPFGLGRFYDNGAIKVEGGIECDFYVNDGYESNNIASTEYGKRLRESAVEQYESLNLYWNEMIH